jgi:hypothetical protein
LFLELYSLLEELGVSVKIKSLPLVIKQNDQSKFEEEIKKILKKALISAHENSKNEVNELITNINNRCFALVSDGRLWFRVP